MRLILASASPRRSELLQAAGIPFDVRPADVDESIHPDEGADAYVRRVSEAKAFAAQARAAGRPVLGADTVVVVARRILGKPRDGDDARRMLRSLSGVTHEVMTGLCLMVPEVRLPPPPRVGPGNRREPGTTGDVRETSDAAADVETAADVRVAVTKVEFAPMTDREIDWYVSTGEPLDKAGAYAIQGFASRFVTRIEGSYSNVVGLPVALVYEMCRRRGILLS